MIVVMGIAGPQHRVEIGAGSVFDLLDEGLLAAPAEIALRDLDLPHDKVNVHGGACALGHPVGASGTRIIVTLLNAMEKYNQTKGVASLCIGGGEATAVAIERVV